MLLVLAPLRGDDPQAEPRMVDLNVIALDSRGQPVPDLTADDFKITDAGKPQKIAFFRHIESKRWQPPALGPHEFSNRSTGNVPRATVILFDMFNQHFATRGVAAGQLVQYLQKLETADYLYLYILTVEGKLYAVHGLPGEEGETRQPGAAPWTRDIKATMDGAMRDVTRVRPVDIDVAVRVPMTFQALDRLAIQISKIPGRKDLVWITDGVPIELGPRRSDTGDFVDFTPLVRAMSDAFDRSAIAIYPVRQVMLGSPDAIGAGAGGGIGSIDTLEQFASITGGRPDAGKDIGAAIQQAMLDVRTSYQIGYYPPARSWNNKLHKLRVTCARKGVRIQSKTAYYAWQRPPDERAKEAIQAALGTTFDAAEIGVRAALVPDPHNAAIAKLQVHVDAGDIALAREGDQYTDQLRVALVSYSPGRQAGVSQVVPIDLHFTAQQRDQFLKTGIPFGQNVQIGEGVTAVRVIVFDRGSDTVGSVTVPVNGK